MGKLTLKKIMKKKDYKKFKKKLKKDLIKRKKDILNFLSYFENTKTKF